MQRIEIDTSKKKKKDKKKFDFLQKKKIGKLKLYQDITGLPKWR